MRKLSVTNIKDSMVRFNVHLSYMYSKMLKGFLFITIILVPIHSFLVFTVLPQQAFRPTPVSTLSSTLWLTSIIFTFIIMYLAYSFASELSGGGAQLFLSHPLGKLEYVSAWFFTGLYVTVFLFLLSIILPVIVLDPTLLSKLSLRELYLLSLEMIVSGAIIFNVALMMKKSGLTFLCGVFFYYILPFVFMLSLAVFRKSSEFVIWMFIVLYPYKSMFIWGYARTFPYQIIQASFLSLFFAVLLHILAFVYSRWRLEVG